MNTGLSAAALIAVLTHPTPHAPTIYTAAQRTEAKALLCERYWLAAHVVHIETTSVALARIAATNGAVILETAAANPALDAKYQDAAHALALTYEDLTAMGTNRDPDDPELVAVVNDSNAKDQVMKELCGE